MSKKAKILLSCAALFAAVICLGLSLFYFGVLKFNNPNREKFPVRGVDVSSYQGKIDWDVLAGQGIRFAYIKATEGSGLTDPYFADNYSSAIKTDLRVGAYHFFSFESAGATQADNFCNTVSPYDNMLPPVVDVEYYGKFKSSADIDAGSVRAELRVFIERIEDTYGVPPVIYVTKESYRDIVKDNFDGCDIWIRSVYSAPPKDVKWSFWQYTNRQKLKGYSGTEKYIDMNVFNGTSEEFENYGKKSD